MVAIFKSKIFRYTVLALFVSGLTLSGAIAYKLYKIAQDLPPVEEIASYRFSQPSLVYDANGTVIAELGTERRYPIAIDDMPDYIRQAVVATEDARFYEHNGVDFLGILRALIKNIKMGRMAEGGSTLTQQLTKNIYLTREKKLMRKYKEAVLAYRIEKYLTKDEILEFYLNYVNFGRGGHGVQAASINYFGKDAKDMTLEECALLAALPKAPGIYAPHISMKKATDRRNAVLLRMLETGYINEQEYDHARNTPVVITASTPLKLRHAGYFLDHVLKHLSNNLDISEPQSKGLKVYTTIDLKYQLAAEIAVQDKLRENARRIGYFGPVGNLKVGMVETKTISNDNESVVSKDSKFVELMTVHNYLLPLGYKKAYIVKVEQQKLEIKFADSAEGVVLLKDNRWASPAFSYAQLSDFNKILKEDDIIYVLEKSSEHKGSGPKEYLLDQDPPMEAALMAVDPQSGAVLAMVGGFAFEKSMFNRSTQALRQTGSVFKAIVYATAVELGHQPMEKILDAPYLTRPDASGEVWRPKNYEDRYYGETTLKEGVTRSRNVVTIKIAEKIGIGNILKYSKLFGITSTLAPDLSTALGSGSVSLMEMTYAYSVFPNMGTRVSEPYFITKIENADGEVLFDIVPPEHVRVIEPNTAHIMTDILVNVVERGTGFRAKGIPRNIAVKTGTTNENKDAWYIGYLPNLAVGVWMGFDDMSMSNVGAGSQAAGPVWVDFVGRIANEVPYAVFPVADGVVYKKVDTETWEPTDEIKSDISFEPYSFEVAPAIIEE